MTSTKDVEAAVSEVTKGLDAGVVGLLPYATAIRKILASHAAQAADLAEYRRGEAEAERTIRSLQDEAAALVEQARLDGEALQRVARPEYGLGFNRLRGIARARLQDREGGVS